MLVLGSVGFFFGWVQFQVPPGQYGVIISKTHGIDPVLVRSGEFRWVWYRLLPTNVRIAVFNPEHTKFPINFQSALPSGNTYASFTGLTNADFSWNVQAEITFSVNPDYLVLLAKQHNLTSQEDLNSYLEQVAKDIEVIIMRTLTSASSLDETSRLENILSGNSDAQMEQEIQSRFPQISNFSFYIRTAEFPDFILYRQLRAIYEEFLAKQSEYVTLEFGRRAERHIEAQMRFNELEQYGDLLTRFPLLLEYMQLGLN